MKWTHVVNAISAKATSQLKRTGAQMSDLLHFYTTIVRPSQSSNMLAQCGIQVRQLHNRRRYESTDYLR